MGGRYSHELDILKHAVREAGDLVLERRQRRMDGEHIRGVETEAAAHITALVRQQFPDYGLLNRWEPKHTRAGHQHVIFFDPLNDPELYKDGELFTVHATLLEHRKGLLNPVAAALYDPSAGELYTAVKGSGAFITQGSPRQHRISVRPDDDIDLIVRHRPENRELASIIERLAPGTAHYMMSLLKIVSVASGEATAYICPTSVHIHLADIAAPQLILEEAGGRITTLAGRPFMYDQKALVNRQGILATNGIVHQRVIEKLS